MTFKLFLAFGLVVGLQEGAQAQLSPFLEEAKKKCLAGEEESCNIANNVSFASNPFSMRLVGHIINDSPWIPRRKNPASGVRAFARRYGHYLLSVF